MADPDSLAPEQRFSNRVENYVRYRPGYPPEILDLLKDQVGLGKGSVVADVGSGTGISSEWLLKGGAVVFGVEPNREMRQAAERLLAGQPGFHSVDGKASATTLEPESMDFIVAAQAFH
ncbi:MAG: class I SAM-dependent methyltransferase [Verrucomicrobiota bacterium]